MPSIKFDLKIGDKVLGATVNVPAEPVHLVELLPMIQQFSDASINAGIPDGTNVSCRSGCAACCRQLILMAETEAFYLADLIAEMEPDRKAVLHSRFEEIQLKLKSLGVLEGLRQEALTDRETRLRTSFEYMRHGLACPFLENESCSIYEHRPLVCREYIVSSPPEHCSPASPEPVERVMVPMYLSNALCRFGDGKGQEPVKVVALPLLPEFASAKRAEDQPLVPGTQLFKDFFTQVTGSAD